MKNQLRLPFLFSAFLFLLCSGLFSQGLVQVGGRAGLNLSTTSAETGGGNKSLLPGLQVGLLGAYQVSEGLHAQVEVLYSQKGGLVNFGTQSSIATRNSYVVVPVMAKLYFGPSGAPLYGMAGFYGGYWFRRSAITRLNGQRVKVVDEPSSTLHNLMDAGLVLDFGTEQNLGGQIINFDLRYEHGLINASKGSASALNRTLSVSAAWLFGL